MLLRTIVAIVGLIELVAPRQVARFWLARCCRNPEDIEVKPWVVAAIRLEGLFLVGWVAWHSRESLGAMTETDRLPEPDAGFDADWGDDTDETTTEPRAPDESDLEIEPDDGDDASPTLTPGTRRFVLGSVLYHTDEPLSVADIVELSQRTDWELGRSPASTTLYRMYNDGAVDRRKGADGSYEYWLLDAARDVLESADAEINPNPLAADEA